MNLHSTSEKLGLQLFSQKTLEDILQSSSSKHSINHARNHEQQLRCFSSASNESHEAIMRSEPWPFLA
jgi:hypothetical protein